jgi:hypothetical protein
MPRAAVRAGMKRVALALLVLATTTACRKSAPGSFGTDAPQAKSSIGSAADFGAETPEAPAAEEGEQIAGAPARDRNRLGTEFGETRQSTITTVPFMRGTASPDVTLALFYDDLEGVRTMAERNGDAVRTESRTMTNDGTFVLTVIDGNGQILTGAEIAGKRYVVGSAGQRYSIGVENHSSERFEVVASVDGLDVIDGEEAGFDKRGYVLEPLSSVMIDGWRTSEETVAAFRFGTVDDSYAERRGKGRNIGVIGAAFFHERGGVAWRDLHQTDQADPFPKRFAPPPPARRF